ncbi:hypothetical protein Patl1_29003 [Pistacia atlantica]|uniref:Uncharacterized protein n=1 Tax=Pistacia atlantica TaxID=434234 RepID=A0ACC1BGM9_9ROSI|nr:hypothetical protein Patl1_29003 [Pistacia atlantica]
MKNVGGHFETWNTGILGPVALHGLDQGKWDLSWQKWTYQVGLRGEEMNLVSPNAFSSVEWMQGSLAAYFNAPEGDEPLALDMQGMGKGQIWINGQSIGRYWTAYANGNCSGCNYAGVIPTSKVSAWLWPTNPKMVLLYHVPRSWLKPTQNLLVLFEELGGNPSRISLMKRSVTSVCAEVTEYHPTIKNWQIESYGKPEVFHSPKAHLRCSPGHTISSIKFASFGTPLGTCGTYQQGACHATTSYDILQKVITLTHICVQETIINTVFLTSFTLKFPRNVLDSRDAQFAISNSNFGQDPCPNVMKRLSVEAVCSPTVSTTNWRG